VRVLEFVGWVDGLCGCGAGVGTVVGREGGCCALRRVGFVEEVVEHGAIAAAGAEE